MTRPFVKDRKDKIVELAITHGMTAADIAERFGCSHQPVARVLLKAGYEWDPTLARWVPQKRETSSSPLPGTK